VQICVGCGKKAPETETNYTLISAQFGWRLTRNKRGDGSLVLEWRCPNCWRDFKRAKPGAAAASPSAPPPGGANGDTPRPPRRTDPPEGRTDTSPPPRRPGRSTR